MVVNYSTVSSIFLIKFNKTAALRGNRQKMSDLNVEKRWLLD
jgi:hypothetical protein